MQEYHRSHSGIGLGDYLTAATALTEGLELATLNVRHYPMSPELGRPPGSGSPIAALQTDCQAPEQVLADILRAAANPSAE
jgi:hypothetical protein